MTSSGQIWSISICHSFPLSSLFDLQLNVKNVKRTTSEDILHSKGLIKGLLSLSKQMHATSLTTRIFDPVHIKYSNLTPEPNSPVAETEAETPDN